MVPDVSKECITIFKCNLTFKMKSTQSFGTTGVTHPKTYSHIPEGSNHQNPRKSHSAFLRSSIFYASNLLYISIYKLSSGVAHAIKSSVSLYQIDQFRNPWNYY
jgi:hypothetical protein